MISNGNRIKLISRIFPIVAGLFAAIWAVFTYINPSPKSAPPETTKVREASSAIAKPTLNLESQDGSIAIVGGVANSTLEVDAHERTQNFNQPVNLINATQGNNSPIIVKNLGQITINGDD